MSDERISIDRLLDLVEGSLPEDEAARLEAALDDDARRELAVQAAVRTVLGQLPGPELSDDERRRLRAAVRAELRVEEAPREPSEGRQERRSWLARVLPSAAAAASVVAMIAVAINLVGGADSVQEASITDAGAAATEQAADVVEVTAAPATTAAPAPAAEAPEDAADPVALAEEAPADRAADEAMAGAAMEADTAAELAEAEMMMEEASNAEDARGPGPGYVAFEVVTDRPEETREMLEMMEELAAISEMAPVPVTELAGRAGEEDLVCWPEAAELAGASGVIIWMAPGLVDGVAGEAYLVAPGPDHQPGTGVLALFVYPDCRAVALRAVTDQP
ncbi:MAG: hypothetical protein OXD34_09100 [bacterium]|nr:hypothetical protein [bacterium]